MQRAPRRVTPTQFDYLSMPTAPSDPGTPAAEVLERGEPADRLTRLQHAIEHAAHWLPTQGPISVFVHHNTLHAFEHLPFEEGLRAGRETHGCEVFLPEDHYRAGLIAGRIRHEELAAVLAEDLGERVDGMLGVLGTRFRLRMTMLEHSLEAASPAELQWAVAETDALRRFRPFVAGPTKLQMVAETRHWVMRDLRNGSRAGDPALARVRTHVQELFTLFGRTTIERWSDARWESFCLHLLWRICRDGCGDGEFDSERRDDLPIRHARLLEDLTHGSADQLVHERLIRFCAAFLDQGYADWRLPDRELGFFRAFIGLYGQAGASPERWLRGLARELKRWSAAKLDPLESISESLELLGVDEHEWEAVLRQTLQALPGWAGMIWQMETNAEWTMSPAPAGSLLGFLAARLLLDRFAVAHVARETLGWQGTLRDLWTELRARSRPREPERTDQRAYLAFQLAQVCGWLPQQLYRLPSPQWRLLLRELEAFDEFERRRVFHRAYERRYRNQVLESVGLHCRQRQPQPHELSRRLPAVSTNRSDSPLAELPDEARSEVERTANAASFQVVCCIDDREESLRRHLEEIDPACETLGAAGFFGVAMYYRGVSEAHFRPLAPVVIKPRHYVVEQVASSYADVHRRRAETRRVLGTASHQVHQGTRTFLGGLVTGLAGTVASIPMVTRILFPRATAQIRRIFGRMVRPPAATQLVLERREANPGPAQSELGFSVEEMAAIVERLLRDIGLTRGFAPIVLICGHGSSSLNNPHESAYNCGACSGGRGGPNARAFAEMANDRRVRQHLAARELAIPDSTVFVGAMHNTCDDSVTYFDLDRLPPSHAGAQAHLVRVMDEARRRNAHERCRRFESAPLALTPETALKHVEGRAEDLSQARPEYNHATSAVCFVGQRWWTRSLFLDRRAFLQSYDPRQDDDQGTILSRILAAVIPVCAGISLEYFWSCVDTTRLGCGSKLPHNITSLLGVMEGAASDLRPGLSQQMVEIHEPMRILFVIETTAEALRKVLAAQPALGRLCRNEWVQLAVLDADTATIQVFQNDEFKPYRVRAEALPVVDCSADWYRGWRDHLGCAAIAEPRSSQ